MDADARPNTRIMLKNGSGYLAYEDVGKVFEATELAWIRVTTTTGQTAFPAKLTVLRTSEIVAIQAVSEEEWVWQQDADARHYARAVSDSPQEELTAAFRKLADG